MDSKQIACTKCGTRLNPDLANSGALQPCASCGALLRIEVFPALFREVTAGHADDALVIPEEASCFFHPEKRAVVPCDMCGRFLCSLCDVDFNGRHLCPSCLEAGSIKGKIASLDNRRTLYDSIALALGIAPILFWPITIVTGPIAIYMAIRYWNAPTSILPRTKVRNVLAILFGLGQIAFWGFLVFAIASAA